MMGADKAGPSLDATVGSIVHQAGGWSEYLAAKVLAALEAVLKAGKPLSAPMEEAYDKSCEALKTTEGFAADHPIATGVLITVIALGILVVFAPYGLELLGFGELGPIEGKSYFLVIVMITKRYADAIVHHRIMGGSVAGSISAG